MQNIFSKLQSKFGQFGNILSENKNIFNENFNWWAPEQQKNLIPLHALNKTRLEYIFQFTTTQEIKNKKVLDYGCGGGLLCEPLARLGANVTGYDEQPACIEAAKKHAQEQNLQINYTNIHPSEQYDIICCFEMLEHVENFKDELVKIKSLLKPCGLLFLSTINKNVKSLIFAKFAAEYILNLVPKGMHNFNNFIKPSDITNFCKELNLSFVDIGGMFYNPITKQSKLTKSSDINYICVFKNE